MEVVLLDVLGKDFHLLDPDGGLGAELHPDGADGGGRWGWVCGGGEASVFFYHSDGGTGGEGHFLTAEKHRQRMHTTIEKGHLG